MPNVNKDKNGPRAVPWLVVYPPWLVILLSAIGVTSSLVTGRSIDLFGIYRMGPIEPPAKRETDPNTNTVSILPVSIVGLSDGVSFSHNFTRKDVEFFVKVPRDAQFNKPDHVIMKFDGFKPNLYLCTNAQEDFYFSFRRPEQSFKAHALVPIMIEDIPLYLDKSVDIQIRD
jgi:hypothetical protein